MLMNVRVMLWNLKKSIDYMRFNFSCMKQVLRGKVFCWNLLLVYISYEVRFMRGQMKVQIKLKMGLGGVYVGLFKFLYYWLGLVIEDIISFVISGIVQFIINDGILGFFIILVDLWYVLVIYFCCVGLILCIILVVFCDFFCKFLEFIFVSCFEFISV